MERLDIYLKRTKKDFSRNVYQKFIRSVGVKVNGKLVKKPFYLIDDNDVVEFSANSVSDFLESLRDTGKYDLSPITIFSNRDFLVVNKPPFITTEVLTAGLFAVHRLDKNTSGILIIAKNPRLQAFLQNQWQEKKIKKTYIALVKGTLSPKTGAIEGNIHRSVKDRRKMALSSLRGSRQAFTEYRVIRTFASARREREQGEQSGFASCEPKRAFKTKPKLTLVKVFPLTGRTHQIRVHFKSIGHPVVGDSLYGDKKLNKKIEQMYGLKRQFLHAYKLSLIDPETKKRVSFSCELPEDLKCVF